MLEKQQILELAHYKMPFGKFKDWYLTDIPEEYFLWFKQKGWPTGKLGTYLQMMLDLKANGDISFLKELRNIHPQTRP